MNRKDWMLVLLSFLGTLLGVTGAFMLDSWKENRGIENSKTLALEQISRELENNSQILDSSYREMNEVKWVLNLMSLEGPDNSIAMPPDTMRKLQSYGRFYELTGSTELDNGLVKYYGNFKITFEYPTLSEIAWETAASMNILGEFGYDCLYEMESAYSLQEITQTQFDRTVESLGAIDIDGLAKNVSLLLQFEKSLLKNYKESLLELENCK